VKSVEPIDIPTIHDQIEKILRSPSFASKSQVKKLLEFLANNIDCQTTLKPDQVIRELWPEETRTKGSADVAKEMNRLRDALKAYYSGEGKSDAVRIMLPNRSKPGPDGLPERRWIALQDASEIEDEPAGASTNRRRVSKIVMMAAVASTCVLAYVLLRLMARTDAPYAGRLDAATLTIVDAEGKELWARSFPDGFWSDYYEKGLATRMWFGDLEGDGHTEVLFLYHPAVSPNSHSSTLICYSDRGKEKWRWTPGRDLPELGGTPSSYRTDGLGVLPAAPGERAHRIVVASGHLLYYPYQIAVVDAHGKTISEYWHSGQINHFTMADLDGDGKQEIFASGISNGYDQATLVVLDPDRVFGASTETARPDLQFHGMGVAQERIRLLFPRSDLNVAVSTYNDAIETVVEHGRVRVVVRECMQLQVCNIAYEFDANFHLISATAYDQFRSAHKEFYLRSKSDHPFTPREEAEFQKVRCLVGCKTEFVQLAAR